MVEIGKLLSTERYPPLFWSNLLRKTVNAGSSTSLDRAMQIPQGWLLNLVAISSNSNTDISYAITVDGQTIRKIESTALDLTHDAVLGVKALRRFNIDITNSGGAAVSDFPVRLGYILERITIAHKLAYPELFTKAGLSAKLTPEEQRIISTLAEKGIDLEKLVALGRYPVSPDKLLQQTQIKTEETLGFKETISTTEKTLISVTPRDENEAVILREITTQTPSAPSDNLIFKITWDGLEDILVLDLSASPGLTGDVIVFIPAVESLEIKASAGVSQTISGRIKIARARLTPQAKIRWGLRDRLSEAEQRIAEEELLEDKIKAGVA